MREVIHEVASEVLIITETNVPHDENISYFGDGDDEAQMVYNFALPPLLAFAILKGDTTKLTAWAKTLKLPSDKVCFFNFTASHDGVGVRAVSDILDTEELDFLVKSCESHGGLVSYRAVGNSDEKLPYELNCSYIDILTDPNEDDNLRLKRMILAQAVTLTMPGVPGIYFHSLVGSSSYHESVRKTRRNRAINREKLNFDNIKEALDEEGSLRQNIFRRYKQLLSIRINEKAFDPYSPFEFLDVSKDVFVTKQYPNDDSLHIVTLYNFTNKIVDVDISAYVNESLIDIITHKVYNKQKFTMQPYDILWLKQIEKEDIK
jgi:sucrose phosphorylase